MAGISCSACGETDTKKLHRCTGCRRVVYCGPPKKCQKEHWPVHKLACKIARLPTTVVLEEDQPLPTLKFREPGFCGVHPVSDLSAYVHALNNMAGSHQIDVPMAISETLEPVEGSEGETVSLSVVPWTTVSSEATLGNGIVLLGGTSVRREGRPKPGVGLRVCGRIRLGDEIAEATGSSTWTWKWSGSVPLRLNSNVVLHPGARVDAYCTLRGPLTYAGIEVAADGGIHYNGVAFTTDGSLKWKEEDDSSATDTRTVEEIFEKGLSKEDLRKEGDVVPTGPSYTEICVSKVLAEREAAAREAGS